MGTHMKMLAQCRQCSFSPNGDVIIAVFDDATVWRFDYRNYGRKKNGENRLLENSKGIEMNGTSKKEISSISSEIIPEMKKEPPSAKKEPEPEVSLEPEPEVRLE